MQEILHWDQTNSASVLASAKCFTEQVQIKHNVPYIMFLLELLQVLLIYILKQTSRSCEELHNYAVSRYLGLCYKACKQLLWKSGQTLDLNDF